MAESASQAHLARLKYQRLQNSSLKLQSTDLSTVTIGGVSASWIYATQPYTDPAYYWYLIKRVHIEELRQRIRTIAD